MHSIAETQTELKALLAKGLDQALKRLETALDPTSPSFNTFVQLKARYSAYLSTVILGMVSQAELDHTYAQLCHAFLLTVDGLSASDLKGAEAPGAAEGPRRGELLYHIPRQMQEQREYRCAVRVAYLRALLREGWDTHRDDAEKSIRVAEVMALPLLNQVRARARGTNNFILPDVTVADQSQLRERIYKERRVELAMEQHRWFDLARWGRLGETLKAIGKNFVDGKHELLPVPQSEVDLTGGED